MSAAVMEASNNSFGAQRSVPMETTVSSMPTATSFPHSPTSSLLPAPVPGSSDTTTIKIPSEPATILPSPISDPTIPETNALKDPSVAINMRIQRGPRPEPDLDWEKLRTLYVMGESGNKIKFTDIFKKQKTLIFLVRHFLDFISKEYVEDLAVIPYEYLQNADVRIVVIGPTEHVFIKDFKEATHFNFTLYTDPERQVYKALGCIEKMSTGDLSASKHIKSGVISGVTSSVWRAMMSSQKRLQGDPKQQGGTFILGPGEQVHFTHADQSAADHCPINQALEIAGVQNVSFPKDPRVQDL